MNVFYIFKVPILSFFVIFATVQALAQGNLNPSGPPAASMKTLSQIEPREPIGSLPFTISRSGSYYVTTNLFGSFASHGITISEDDVSVDLNGFTMNGGRGSLSGIYVDGKHDNIVVRNGAIRNWDIDGISAVDAENCLFLSLRLYGNGNNGMLVGVGCTIQGCHSIENGFNGFQMVSNCTITASNAYQNGVGANGAGIRVTGPGNRIDGNHTARNDYGIRAQTADNIIVRNMSGQNNIIQFNLSGMSAYGSLENMTGGGQIQSTSPYANIRY